MESEKKKKGGIWKFVKDSFYLVRHPIKAAQKQIEEKRLAEHLKKIQTDPEYIADVLDPKKKVEAKGGFSLSTIIGAFITLLVGFFTLGQVTNVVNETIVSNSTASQLTATTTEMLKLIPAFFGLAILGVVIMMVFSGLKRAGYI